MLNRLDHTTLVVDNLEESVNWYSNLIGLKVLDRSDERVLLSVADDHADLTLIQGDSAGLRDFAFGVADSATLAAYEQRLSDAGLKVERPADERLGVDERIRFALPTGHVMELQTGKGREAGVHDTEWDGSSATPTDICHINLVTDDPEGLNAFLGKHLDFTTHLIFPAPGDQEIFGYWMHTSDFHHDIAFMKMPGVGSALHHLSFAAASLEHLGTIADSISEGGSELEFGPGHHPEANLFMYAFDPSGNRIEWSANMPVVPYDSEPYRQPADTKMDRWSDRTPESFFTAVTAGAV